MAFDIGVPGGGRRVKKSSASQAERVGRALEALPVILQIRLFFLQARQEDLAMREESLAYEIAHVKALVKARTGLASPRELEPLHQRVFNLEAQVERVRRRAKDLSEEVRALQEGKPSVATARFGAFAIFPVLAVTLAGAATIGVFLVALAVSAAFAIWWNAKRKAQTLATPKSETSGVWAKVWLRWRAWKKLPPAPGPLPAPLVSEAAEASRGRQKVDPLEEPVPRGPVTAAFLRDYLRSEWISPLNLKRRLEAILEEEDGLDKLRAMLEDMDLVVIDEQGERVVHVLVATDAQARMIPAEVHYDLLSERTRRGLPPAALRVRDDEDEPEDPQGGPSPAPAAQPQEQPKKRGRPSKAEQERRRAEAETLARAKIPPEAHNGHKPGGGSS